MFRQVMRLSRLRAGCMGRRLSLLGTCMLVAGATAGVPSSLAATGTGQVRVGGAPAVARTARDIGGLAAATRMHVTIVLKARDPAGLAAYAREVSTPGSPA